LSKSPTALARFARRGGEKLLDAVCTVAGEFHSRPLAHVPDVLAWVTMPKSQRMHLYYWH